MKAMLFAAGLGTRLKPFTDHHPKALATIGGRTLLEHSIRYLQGAGIFDVVVNVHHFGDQITDLLRDSAGFGSRIGISDERDAVLETGGGLLKAMPFFDGEEDILALNVDAMTDLDLTSLLAHHRKHRPLATLAVMQRSSSRGLLFNADLRLCGWQNKATGETRSVYPLTGSETLLSFTGIQVISTAALNNLPFSGKFSLIDMYLHLAAQGPILAWDHTGDTFIDVGRPESLAEAETLLTRIRG